MSQKPRSKPQRVGDRIARRAAKPEAQYWSGRVTRESNALDLEPDVFTLSNPARIARSLKRSAEASARRKGTPYQSAMSMLSLYINRAGTHLPHDQKRVLEESKVELRKLFGRA